MQSLYARATYDLGCTADQLRSFAVDGRTQALSGCGRRLVYVEHCDPALGAAGCSWILDTPTFNQAQWPQRAHALAEHQRRREQARGAPPPSWGQPPRRRRTFSNDLGSPAELTTVTPPVSAAPSAQKKPTDRPRRPFRESLFDDEPKRAEEQRHEDALGF